MKIDVRIIVRCETIYFWCNC